MKVDEEESVKKMIKQKLSEMPDVSSDKSYLTIIAVGALFGLGFGIAIIAIVTLATYLNQFIWWR
jgi:hypothetical protein